MSTTRASRSATDRSTISAPATSGDLPGDIVHRRHVRHRAGRRRRRQGPAHPVQRRPHDSRARRHASRVFTVSAIYHVGNERYDRYVVFLPIEAAKSLFGQDEGYPIVGIRLADPDAADAFAATPAPRISPTTSRHGSSATAPTSRRCIVERNVMRLILFIVVIITALNIITGVLMLVKNKARDVAILRTIGATRAGVVRIFLMSGTFLGTAGVATGVAARRAVRALYRADPALPRMALQFRAVPAGHLHARLHPGEAGMGRGRAGSPARRSW